MLFVCDKMPGSNGFGNWLPGIGGVHQHDDLLRSAQLAVAAVQQKEALLVNRDHGA